MKRIFLVALAGALLLALSAGTALAINIIQCKNVPCNGTAKADRILERIGNEKRDRIFAKDGADVVAANNYRKDTDEIFGQGKNDRIRTDDGDTLDSVDCGGGDANIAVIDTGDTAAANCQDVRVNFTGSAAEFATGSRADILAHSDPASASG
jgi:hypothetical protein